MIELNRKVLTTKEIMGIAVSMREEDTYIGRQVCKYSLLVAFLTDYELPKDKDGMIILKSDLFDEWYSNGTIKMLDESVINIEMVDREYESLVDIKTAISELTKSMQVKLDKFNVKDIDFASVMKQVKEVIAIGNKQ